MNTLTLVAKDTVVSFHYTLTDKAGEVLDSSQGGQPLVYLHGYSQIVPGLENALLGKAAGSAFKVADRIAFLSEGRIVEEGTPGELRRSTHPRVAAFLRTWAGKAA